MVEASNNFSRIYLRTKIGSPVFIDEVDPREIMLSNYEKVLYVKDFDGDLLAFLPNDDNLISDSKTWSSEKITEWVTNYIAQLFDIIDAGTF